MQTAFTTLYSANLGAYGVPGVAMVSVTARLSGRPGFVLPKHPR